MAITNGGLFSADNTASITPQVRPQEIYPSPAPSASPMVIFDGQSPPPNYAAFMMTYPPLSQRPYYSCSPLAQAQHYIPAAAPGPLPMHVGPMSSTLPPVPPHMIPQQPPGFHHVFTPYHMQAPQMFPAFMPPYTVAAGAHPPL